VPCRTTLRNRLAQWSLVATLPPPLSDELAMFGALGPGSAAPWQALPAQGSVTVPSGGGKPPLTRAS